jgi:cellulose synthase/poly-beta-1,6-N-acetylglucosamine synthase-like glycosyltransferase
MERPPLPPITPRDRSGYEHRSVPVITPHNVASEPISRYVPESYYRRNTSSLVTREIILPGHNQSASTYIREAAAALNLPGPVVSEAIQEQNADADIPQTAPAVDAPVSGQSVQVPATETGKRKLALLLPGHNEELIIALTIQSAVTAGQDIRDIFVVDDNSNDQTRKIAVSLLGKSQVLTVKRSGKALAVKKALKKFKIADNYEWVHVADADSVFSPDYFREYVKHLTDDYVVAVGFVQSLRGNWISTYRALSYTFSQHVNRRIQAKLDMISVFPGPITAFRTDILDKLDFQAKTITEDFDITLQVHRYNLGKIAFIPKAINYTQDPQTFRDFCKQTQRWQRGFFQCIQKYHIGLQTQRIDISLGFQMMQMAFFMFQLLVLIPIIMILTHDYMYIPVWMTIDFIMNSLIAIWASFAIRRWNLLGALPYFYFLRWVEVAIFLWSGYEVVVLRRFREEIKGWATEGRRYAVNSQALQDIA